MARYVPRRIPELKRTPYTITEDGVVENKEAYDGQGLVSDNGDIVVKVWDMYATATRRANHDIPEGVTDELREALEPWKNMPFHKLSDIIRSSSYLSPHEGDDDDYKRLIDVLTTSRSRMVANRLSKDLRSSPIPYSTRSSIAERIDGVLDTFGADSIEDYPDDDAAAIYQLARIPKHVFEDSYTRTCAAVEKLDRDIRPRDVITMEKSRLSLFPGTDEDLYRNIVKKQRNRTNEYDAGRIEDDLLASYEFEADVEASEMADEGFPLNDVRMFHEDVPRGYWEAVVDFLESDESSGDPEEAYEHLKEEFKFHPSMRDRPNLI